MDTVALQVKVNESTSYQINSRHPVFRVYRRGALKAVGTAQQLQTFFGIRHRELKVKLLKQAQEPEEIQMTMPYQVQLEAEYLIEVEAERKFAKELADEINNEYIRPATLEEEEAHAQPNKEELLEALRKKNCRHRRYRIRRRLSERLAGGMDAPETDTVLMPNGERLVVVFGDEGDVEDWMMREEKAQPLVGRRLGGGIDRTTRKTKIEQDLINQRNERMAHRRASLLSKM